MMFKPEKLYGMAVQKKQTRDIARVPQLQTESSNTVMIPRKSPR